MDILSKINDLIHDNTIVSYLVDFEKQSIDINTKKLKEESSIKFQGVLVHKFENGIKNNIIYEISEIPVEEFLEFEKENLLKSMAYGYPIANIGSIEEIKEVLIEKKYKIYYIISSLGMTGYIIAKDISIL